MHKLTNCYISRHGIYYVRLRIPKKLRQYTNQTELRMSLHTQQIRTAHNRAVLIQSEAQAIFNWIKRMTDKPSPLSIADQNHIWGKVCEKVREEFDDNDSAIENEALKRIMKIGIAYIKKHDPNVAKTPKKLGKYSNNQIEEIAYACISEHWRKEGSMMLSSEDILAPTPTPSSIPKADSSLPQAPTTTNTTSTTSSITLEELLNQLIDEAISNDKPISDDITNRYRVLNLLLDTFLHGNTIDQLSRDQWIDAYNMLKYFPKGISVDSFPTKYPAIKKAFDKKDTKSNENTELSTSTLGAAQARLKRLCNTAYEGDWIKKDYLTKKKPAKVSKKEKRQNKYISLNNKDIHALLNGYLFDINKEPPDYRTEHHSWQFWFLPIALYTGMRRTEIAQLHASDVKYDDGNEVWYIHVNDEETRKIKSDASDRLVPIHQQLVDCGFLKFVEERRKDKFPVLFPHLWLYSDESKGKRNTANSAGVSRWFIRKDSPRASKPARNEGNYFYDVGVNEDKKVLHSTRHTFVGQLRRLGVANIEMANVVGHEDGLMTEGYGEEQFIRDNLIVINQLDYGEFGSLAHLDHPAFQKRLAGQELPPKHERVTPRPNRRKGKKT